MHNQKSHNRPERPVALDDYFEKGRRTGRGVPAGGVERLIETASDRTDNLLDGEQSRRPGDRLRLPLSVGLSIVALLTLYLAVDLFKEIDGLRGTTANSTGPNSNLPTDGGSGTVAGEGGSRSPSVTYFTGCPLQDVWSYDVNTSAIAPTLIDGAALLELNDQELGRLGVLSLEGGGAEIYSLEEENGGLVQGPTYQFTTSESTISHRTATLPDNVTPSTLMPRIVTDPDGRRRFFQFNYDEIDPVLDRKIREIYTWTWEKWGDGKVSARAYDSLVKGTGVDSLKEELHRKAEASFRFDEMIPIVVHADYLRSASTVGYAGRGSDCSPVLILWYDATPEVLALLPHNWRERMVDYETMYPALANRRRMEEHLRQRIEEQEKDRRDQELKSREEPTGQKRSIERLGERRGSSNSLSDANGVKGSEKSTTVERRPTQTSISDERLQSEPISPGGEGVERPGSLEVSGALSKMMISPNPVEEQGLLSFHLTAKRNLALSLHTMSGYRIAVLLEDASYDPDDHQYAIDFSTIPPGLYLLVLSSDRGEQLMQRVVVN